ncbi:MAG: ERAP1-like C-terminal domain-containing protein [Myxococcales bacterium]|nr:ERAP1-like C-terminal domain-containing protein [Myxococcales bacterium]
MEQRRLGGLVAIGVAAMVMACSAGPARPAAPAPEVAVGDDAGAGLVAEPPPLAPPQPTLRLPTNFVPTGYQARLAIDPAAPTFDGEIAIAGTIAARSTVVWLHGRGLEVTAAVARQGAAEVALAVAPRGDDLLELTAAAPLPAGAWTLALRYRGQLTEEDAVGVFRQYVDGAPQVFTQFEPLSARRVFPCVDEPAVKVPWQLTLDVPAGLIAVANAPVQRSTPLDADRVRVEFAPTPPLPSYLIAFAVGRFEIVDAGATRGGAPIRIVTSPGRGVDAAWIAQHAAAVVAALEDWFGSPYPFAKLDLVTIPRTAGFGAMENPGLVTFGETLLLLGEQATVRQRYDALGGAAHELAHQWFGDLVTMAWWDDLWLNEGFATWMEAKVLAALDPTSEVDLGLEWQRESALVADRLVSARRVRQPIAGADDVVTAFDGITYAKGAAVLTMIERWIGPAPFQAAVRAYLAAHARGNATSADFIAALEAAAPGTGSILASFIELGGAPLVSFALRCDGAMVDLTLTQERWLPAGAVAPAGLPPPWRVPVCVGFERDGARAEQCTVLAQPSATLRLATTTCPRWLVPNVGGAGYYRARMPASAFTALVGDGWAQLSAAERMAVFADFRADVEAGRAEVDDMVVLASQLLAEPSRTARTPGLGWFVSAAAYLGPTERQRLYVWLRGALSSALVVRGQRVGWLPRADDDLLTDWIRRRVLPIAAAGGDRALRAEAVRLARRWRTLPLGLQPVILGVAADADLKTFRKLRADLATTTRVGERQALLSALGGVTDPVRQREALALTLDPAIAPTEVLDLLYAASALPQQDVVREFFRDNQAALQARLPDAALAPADVASILVGCDAATRDRDVAYVRATFGDVPGGAPAVAQTIERADQCIARRAALEPGLRRWLATLPAKGSR